MDSYFRKINNLQKQGDSSAHVIRSSSVSRASSPQPTVKTEGSVEVKPRECKKIVYKEELNVVLGSIENIKGQLLDVQVSLKDKVDQINSQLVNLKNELNIHQEQSKVEKLKNKLDDFVSKYNQNEISHSDSLKQIENDIQKLDVRVSTIEEMF